MVAFTWEGDRIQGIWALLHVIRSGNGVKNSRYDRNRRGIAGLRARISEFIGMDCVNLLDNSGFRTRDRGDSGIQ